MRWTDEELATLRRLWSEGHSFRVIGAHLNRSGDAVYRKGKELGLGAKPLAQTDRSPTWALIRRLCADGRPRTVHEIARLTGAGRSTVDQLFKKHRSAGDAHVVTWDRRCGAPVPYWLPEPGKSAKRPKVMTSTERARLARKRMKEEDPLRYKLMIDRNTINRARRNGTVPRQHRVMNALFGRYAR